MTCSKSHNDWDDPGNPGRRMAIRLVCDTQVPPAPPLASHYILLWLSTELHGLLRANVYPEKKGIRHFVPLQYRPRISGSDRIAHFPGTQRRLPRASPQKCEPSIYSLPWSRGTKPWVMHPLSLQFPQEGEVVEITTDSSLGLDNRESISSKRGWFCLEYVIPGN